jgi:adenylate cyclase class IV
MAHFEIEIKSLLGEPANAEALKEKMHATDPVCACTSTSSQLNHYFHGGDIEQLYANTEHLFSGEQHERFRRVVEKGSAHSVRTREKDGEVLLVVKASLDAGTSENTVSRLEFEEPVAVSLEDLDALVQKSGYEYQAKWSRDREEYTYKGANVCIDRNAGYGYLAEFEKVTDDEASLPVVRADLEALMAELGVEELSQDRLARMFAFYNENWPEYYGTDRTFTIE